MTLLCLFFLIAAIFHGVSFSFLEIKSDSLAQAAMELAMKASLALNPWFFTSAFYVLGLQYVPECLFTYSVS